MIREATDGIIGFPCDFPIKAIGNNVDNLNDLIIGIVRNHMPEFKPKSISIKTSQKGKYISVTVTIRVSNKQILDSIYRELSSNKKILMVL